MHIQRKTIGIHKKELKNIGYIVIQERSNQKTFYTVVSRRGKTVLEVVKFRGEAMAMNKQEYLYCDKAVIKAEHGKAMIECYTYCPGGTVVERIEEKEGES